MLNHFGILTEEDATNILAGYLPEGDATAAASIDGTAMRKTVAGLAKTFFRRHEAMNYLADSVIDLTNEQIVERWEEVLGLPDEVYPSGPTATIENRQLYIKAKLYEDLIETADDVIWFAALFGITVVVYHGIEMASLPLPLPTYLFPSDKEARFTLVISYGGDVTGNLPAELPMTLADNNRGVFEKALYRTLDSCYNLLTL
jgi:uncharacterized protein YmfQ (DUF2313 family)